MISVESLKWIFTPLEVLFRGWEVASLTQRVESYRMGWSRSRSDGFSKKSQKIRKIRVGFLKKTAPGAHLEAPGAGNSNSSGSELSTGQVSSKSEVSGAIWWEKRVYAAGNRAFIYIYIYIYIVCVLETPKQGLLIYIYT